MSTSPADSAKKAVGLCRRLANLWPYFNLSRGLWTVAIVATVLAGATEALFARLLQIFIDSGFQRKTLEPWLVPPLLIGLAATRGVLAYLAEFALVRVASNGIAHMRQELFAHLLGVDLDVLRKHSASSMANTIIYEVQTGAHLLVHTVLDMLRNTAMVAGLLAYLIWLNWQLTLIVIAVFPLVAWVARALSRRLYTLTQSSQNATDSLAYVVEENVLAHRIVRLHGAQAEQSARFEQANQQLMRLSIKSAMASATASPVSQLLISMALSGVISVALYQSQTHGFTVGSFAGFITAMLMLIDPVKFLSRALTPIARGLAALERGKNFLQHTKIENTGTLRPQNVQGHIRFEQVSVRYPGRARNALEDLSLDIASGTTVAFVGQSGSGKSTLANLVPRFVSVTAGQVRIDGIPVQQWDLAWLRAQIALVSQDVVLFNQSVARNITLGAEFDTQRVLDCIRAAHLEEFVTALPQGIDTVLGHNASQLSGGQRQRLAIARALYKEAPILILDEATSALDNESERAVQLALRRLMQGRTCLVIAHRLSTIESADRIVVLDNGKLVESGTHQELMQRKGRYVQLHAQHNAG